MKGKGILYFVVLVFFGVVIYQGMGKLAIENPAVKLTEHDQLIMYSVTGCEYCEVKRRELNTAEIPYVEYVVDRDPGAWKDLSEKMSQAGFSSKDVGYPAFDVKGTLILNNPPLFQIRKLVSDNAEGSY